METNNLHIYLCFSILLVVIIGLLESSLRKPRGALPHHSTCAAESACTQDVILESAGIPHQCLPDGRIEVNRATMTPEIMAAIARVRENFDRWDSATNPDIVYFRRK